MGVVLRGHPLILTMKLSIVSVGSRTLHGMVVRCVTGKPFHPTAYNHSCVKFVNDRGNEFYFEAVRTKDKAKYRVKGPTPWTDLILWAEAKEHRHFVEQPIPLNDKQISAAFQFCKESNETEGINDAEFAARAWYAADPANCVKYLLNDGYLTFDMITPAGKFGLHEAVERFLQDKKKR